MGRVLSLSLVVVTACGFTGAGAGSSDAAPPADASVDATAPMDGPDGSPQPPAAFDPAVCGSKYIQLGVAHYRLDPIARAAWEAHDLCRADVPGATHLVVLDDLAERDAVQGLINASKNATRMFWVGGVQKKSATQIGADWLAITGGPMLADAWHEGEPTDDDMMLLKTEVHAEQFVRLNRDEVGLVDAPGEATGHGSICECDGKPVDPVAQQAVTDSTVN